MSKLIKINLFEKNRKKLFNKISIEDKISIEHKIDNIFINVSNKHLNGNIIDEYIKLSSKSPQLELGKDPRTNTESSIIPNDNIKIYSDNIIIIKKLKNQLIESEFTRKDIESVINDVYDFSDNLYDFLKTKPIIINTKP